MINRTTRLRWRRRVRHSRRHVEDMGYQAEEQLERNFIRRLGRLSGVRRFVAGWLALLIFLATAVVMQTRSLSGYYQALQPVPGGSYAEGIVGSFTNANPLYATSAADITVSRLIFAGLLSYNQNNELVPDLAQSWSVNTEGTVYTVHLRPNLTWHDDRPLTASDVAFTFRMAQSPDSQSPLTASLRGIKIAAVDALSVTFTLPSAYTPFIYSLTTGLIPEHALKQFSAAQLRSATFNSRRPVGAGPFRWDKIEVVGNDPETVKQRIGLKAARQYYRGTPKIEQFVVNTYTTDDEMVAGFERQEVDAMVGLEQVPDKLASTAGLQSYSAPLTAEAGAFFNAAHKPLDNVLVRRALVQAVDVPALIAELSYPAVVADEPVLHDQFAYDSKLRQLKHSAKQAAKLLDKAGWKRADDSLQRTDKKGQPLRLKLYGENTADFTLLSQQLQKAWQNIGVGIEVSLLAPEQLQTGIKAREYDILLYNIAIGADPDVFVYWHSSQDQLLSPTRLNLSAYRSKAADAALEAGRSRLDPRLRKAKYEAFLQTWRQDAPALMLYQPQFLYVTRGKVYNFDPARLNTPTDRFANVSEWMIREGRGLKE